METPRPHVVPVSVRTARAIRSWDASRAMGCLLDWIVAVARGCDGFTVGRRARPRQALAGHETHGPRRVWPRPSRACRSRAGRALLTAAATREHGSAGRSLPAMHRKPARGRRESPLRAAAGGPAPPP